jgi:hypothetical protein
MALVIPARRRLAEHYHLSLDGEGFPHFGTELDDALAPLRDPSNTH